MHDLKNATVELTKRGVNKKKYAKLEVLNIIKQRDRIASLTMKKEVESYPYLPTVTSSDTSSIFQT